MNAKTFKNKERYLYLLPTLALDLLVQIIVFRICASRFHYWDPADLVMLKQKVVYFLIVGFIIAAFLFPPKLYNRGIKVRDIFVGAFMQTLFTLGICSISVDVLFNSFAGKLYLPDGIIATFAVFILNIILKQVIDFARRNGRDKVHVVVVGEDENARRLYSNLSASNRYEYKAVGYFPDEFGLDDFLEHNKVHELYCSLPPATCADRVNAIIRKCENLFIDFYYVPNMDGYMRRSMSFNAVDDITVVKLREEPLADPLNRALKRLFDIVISGLFLISLYPFIWVFVAIGTTISSPGPILFRQKRTGYRGKSFTMLKFRSMKVNADADRLQATANDPRKTRFGDFLRRSSIDELPQFINVFKGDMSIIGPRPHMELHTEMYNKLVDEYMVRHMVKPGLTGWAQVNGCRGETKEVSQMAARVRNDIWYIENWSIYLDIKIFFMTILQVFKGDSQAY